MDERSDGAKLLRRGIRKPGLLGVRHQPPREVIGIERAEMLSVQPHGLGIEGVLAGEVDGCVAAVDAVERERLLGKGGSPRSDFSSPLPTGTATPLTPQTGTRSPAAELSEVPPRKSPSRARSR